VPAQLLLVEHTRNFRYLPGDPPVIAAICAISVGKRRIFMRADVILLPWDGAPSVRLQRQIDKAATALGARLGRAFKMWVWLERTTPTRGGLHYVRLEVAGLAGIDDPRVRVDSTAASWEQAFRRAMIALQAVLAGGGHAQVRLKSGDSSTGIKRTMSAIQPGKRPWLGSSVRA
jgi:hypothetical protein